MNELSIRNWEDVGGVDVEAVETGDEGTSSVNELECLEDATVGGASGTGLSIRGVRSHAHAPAHA